MRVKDYLKEIEDKLVKESGYPYPQGSKVDPHKAFAYGMAIGGLSFIRREWEQERERDTK